MIKREALKTVKEWMVEPEVLVILGPRQVGKTTLMGQTVDYLTHEKKVSKDNILSFNLDFAPDRQKLQTQEAFAEMLIDKREKTFVFIDEVQRLEKPGIYLKGLIDKFSNAKFIVSGSSSLEIRSKMADILTGRKHVIHLWPLSVDEVREDKNYLNNLMITGGYPLVYVTKSKDIKIARLEEIITSYMQKDIGDYLGIELVESYKKLLVLLSDQVGDLVNISRLSNKLNLHYQTIERYISALQNTFVIDLIYPFSTKPSIEIVKSPVPYFWDLGIRNSLINNFQELGSRKDSGKLFENLVYTELKKIVPRTLDIRFWRTKSKNEVDFVLTNRIKSYPIEAKFQDLESPVITTSMKAFIENYEPELMLVVNKKLKAEKRWGSAIIKYITLEELSKEVDNFKW